MASQTVSFTIDDEHDADLQAWLDKQEPRQRSAAIRKALRAGITGASVTLADLAEGLRQIKRMLRSGVAVQADGAGDDAEDPEAAAVADKLAGLGL